MIRRVEDRRTRRLYPEAWDVGLSAPLQAELDRLGSRVRVSWPDPGVLWSAAKHGSRSAGVVAAVEQRAFGVDCWHEGVEYLSGWTSSLPEVAQVFDLWLGTGELGAEELAGRFTFLDFLELARAYERGEGIEHLWLSLLENVAPDEPLRPLIDEAAAHPTLRKLRPWTSLDRLCFSRWFAYPFSNDLPYAAPAEVHGRFRVWRASPDAYLARRREDLLGEGDAAHAVELIVAALPEPLDIG